MLCSSSFEKIPKSYETTKIKFSDNFKIETSRSFVLDKIITFRSKAYASTHNKGEEVEKPKEDMKPEMKLLTFFVNKVCKDSAVREDEQNMNTVAIKTEHK